MSPSCSICSSLASLARQPTIAMNKGIKGAATIKISAASHEYQATAATMNKGSTRTRSMALW